MNLHTIKKRSLTHTQKLTFTFLQTYAVLVSKETLKQEDEKIAEEMLEFSLHPLTL